MKRYQTYKVTRSSGERLEENILLIDLQEVVAVFGQEIYLRGGSKIRVDYGTEKQVRSDWMKYMNFPIQDMGPK
jgi:hypothetical protein